MNATSLDLFALMKDPNQPLMPHEWTQTKRWLKQPSTIMLIVVFGILESLGLTIFKFIYWAFLLDDRMRHYLFPDKLEELLVSPLKADMLFPAILLRPVTLYAVIALASLPFSVVLVLLSHFLLALFGGFSALGARFSGVADVEAGASLLVTGLQILVLPIAVGMKYVAALAVSAFAAKRLLRNQSPGRAFLWGALLHLCVALGLWCFGLIMAIPVAFLTMVVPSPELGRQFATMIGTGVIAPALVTVIYWLIYLSALRPLQSPWLMSELQRAAEEK